MEKYNKQIRRINASLRKKSHKIKGKKSREGFRILEISATLIHVGFLERDLNSVV